MSFDTARPYLESLLNAASLIFSLGAFLPYFKRRKSANFIGTLLFFLLVCINYSVFHSVDSLAVLLSSFALKLPLVFTSWFKVLRVLATNFVYIGGAALALDRFCVMAFPLNYAHWKLSGKLCVAAATLCGATSAVLLGANAFLPFNHQDLRVMTTNVFLMNVGVVYDVVVLLELLLHVAFCVAYHRFKRRQRRFAARAHVLKANRITLVLILSQTVFCLLPKIVHKINVVFFSYTVRWMFAVGVLYSLLFAVNVSLISAFILFTLRRRGAALQRSVSVVKISAANTQRTL